MASQFFIGKKEDIEVSVDNGDHFLFEEHKGKPYKTDGVALDVIVIGAGTSGLGAAITLSRAGHNVVVLEKSEFKREAGFMITMGSNAVRILNSFDFDYVRARAVNCEAVEIFNGHTLESVTRCGMEVYNPGEELIPRTFYRPDLHNELKRIALLRSPNFKSPSLRLGAEVVEIDIENAKVTLKDGTKLTADLLVGADGERSLLKAQFGDKQSLRQAPYKIFRTIVPTEKLTSEKDLAVLKLTRHKFAIFMSLGGNISWFEGQDGLLQDLEAGYMLSDDDDLAAELDPKKAFEQMIKKFSGFHPDLVNALRKAELVSDWEVYFSRPLAHTHKGKAILIGDAAHSMFPTTGQGGGQGIEDVGALGVLLSSLGSKAELESRLKTLEELRKERTMLVQSLSGIVFGMEEDFANSRPWHMVNKVGITNTEEHLKFLYEYNVLSEARKALEQSTKAKANL